MKILLMVASLIILGNKIRCEYLQDEIIGELSCVVFQDGRPRRIVLVARWMIDIGCRWRGKAGILRVSKRDVRVQPTFWRYDSMNVDDSYGIIIPLIYPMIDLTLEVTKRDLILCYLRY